MNHYIPAHCLITDAREDLVCPSPPVTLNHTTLLVLHPLLLCHGKLIEKGTRAKGRHVICQIVQPPCST